MSKKTNVKAQSTSPPATCSAERTAKLLEIAEAIKAGYGGVLPSGQVVDRRYQPHAMPIPANPLMGTPEPRSAIEQDCQDCYGGHFRPCQMCGDTGKVVFLPNAQAEASAT
jgi:hypothetical protein